MPLANVNDRSSAIHVGLPWRGLFPAPDGSINANDRAHAATFLGARMTPLITSSTILQQPVDCVMAGNQKEFKGGRAHLGALRGIFNE